jgi:hypothetical protein
MHSLSNFSEGCEELDRSIDKAGHLSLPIVQVEEARGHKN